MFAESTDISNSENHWFDSAGLRTPNHPHQKPARYRFGHQVQSAEYYLLAIARFKQQYHLPIMLHIVSTSPLRLPLYILHAWLLLRLH